jgi:hypothetical protein
LVKDGDGNSHNFLGFDDSHVTGDKWSNVTDLPSNVLSESDLDLDHLTIEQRKELINLLDNISECFLINQGFVIMWNIEYI